MKNHTLRRLISIADQGVQAFGNLVITVLLARWLPVEGFAEVATALTIWFFFEALQRTGIIMPYISDVPEPRENRSAHTSWLVINFAFLITGTVILIGLGQVLTGTIGAGVQFASYIVPAAGFYFYTRRVLYHEDRIFAVFCVSTLNVAFMFLTMLLMFLDVFPITSATAVALYAGTYFLAGGVGIILLRKGFVVPRRVFGYMHSRMNEIQMMSLGAICAYFYNNGIQLIIAGFAAAQEAAAFSATRVLVRPLNVISVAFSDIERSAASKAYYKGGDAALDGFVWRMFAVLVAILLPMGMALFWLTPNLLSFLFADKYIEFETTARLWILALLPQVIALPLDIKQSVKKQSESLLTARFAGAMASMVTVLGSAVLFGHIQAWMGVAAVGSGRLVSLIVMQIKN